MTQRACFIECPFCTDPVKVKVAVSNLVPKDSAQSGWDKRYRLTDYPASCRGCHREFPGGIELTQQELAQAYNQGEA